MAAPKSHEGVPMPVFFNEEGYRLFNELELEDDDVVMVSIVKAGTTWVNKIIHCLLRMDDDGMMPEIDGVDLGASGQIYPEWLPAKKPDDPDWVGVGPNGLMGQVDFSELISQPKPRLFSTHLPGQLLPRALERRGRVVYVLRNPKDCLNSLHYFRGAAKDGWLGNEHGLGSLERYLSGVNAYGSFFDHVEGMADYLDSKVPDRHLVVYYEELHNDIRSNIRELANFLKVKLTEDKLEAVVRTTSFKAMSSGSAGTGVSSMLCRKGVCCDWVSAPLTPDHWARIDKAFEKQLGHLKIAQPLRPYLTSPEVNEVRDDSEKLDKDPEKPQSSWWKAFSCSC